MLDLDQKRGYNLEGLVATASWKVRSEMWTTKQISIAVLITFFSPLVVRYLIVNSPASGESRYQILHANPLAWLSNRADASVAGPENTQVVAVAADASSSLDTGNSSLEGLHWLDTWNHMTRLANISAGLPHATEAINDARTAWENLTTSVQNASSPRTKKERLCPYSIRTMNASKSEGSNFTISIPCGLVAGSSVTVIGTPGSLSGNFWIDLVGTALPGESQKPIIVHYNVRLTGDKLTEGPVIVQNTFTASNGWGYEDRCPCKNSSNATEGT
jgi:beta-1,3-galactosyltransferase